MGAKMNSVNKVFVELSVVLGKTTLPIQQLLKMGRGAVIELNTRHEDDVLLLANNIPIARGQIVVEGERIAISVTELISQQAD
ncbi:FliM/FliN family flagellar motor switch protein [Parvibaculum sp.]|jgi:flagellar motor switch protein FliN/FliY|uniref:FliM/FliN family flagellar motor switch protein n=1 Tax=Parvibaculum sp. TaxID=2024848 RepID=UPI0025EC7B6D|nr:FliM/FliN family flagellar motor switch protein [Parvibaculum sp.]